LFKLVNTVRNLGIVCSSTMSLAGHVNNFLKSSLCVWRAQDYGKALKMIHSGDSFELSVSVFINQVK